ncbi:anaerobic ribonucleoside-triphosphate reductase activating protein [Paenibacillus anaericanus]|uniref:Anaerobic ribonucleoside-triphosphate reductase-activating protein n=1 Tax=Paenibacillus anaericanus TaxID=170367 RepID=A0A433YF01_9BACL|nr:anaerobic ribonucleoside-triphosphate reductase activating protein [Paenibacillus anaericanus]RUT48433.1 anaerobic ribonucleoside-triphosphate reductase activating protein [Paenibacillus anaericanus]
MNICGYYPESINEGEGLRASIFVSGCRHFCKGCFSPATWNFNYGDPFTKEREAEIINDIKNNPLLSGVTILGGDPFFSASEVSAFIERLVQEVGPISIWIYSGYTYEELIEQTDSPEYELLRRCQVLVDGRFVEKLRDPSLLYCGSSNQRLIDIQQSLSHGEIKLWKPTYSF